MTPDDLALLGPLAPLVGSWQGDKGQDIAPDEDLTVETNHYREELHFEPTGLVENHTQSLYGLRYRTTAWRLGADDPFHEEVGYWLWDGDAGQVYRCFIVPRGVSVVAGGDVAADARQWHLRAEVGSDTFGICSQPFLTGKFQTVAYTLDMDVGDGTFSYREDTVLKIAGLPQPFHHTDENTLTPMG
jgi:hypothetical protein